MTNDFFADYKLRFDDPEDCTDVLESVDNMTELIGELSKFIATKAEVTHERDNAQDLLKCLVLVKTDVLDFLRNQAKDALVEFQTEIGCNTDCPRYAQGTCPYESKEECPRNKRKE